jgi:hypothetical protein
VKALLEEHAQGRQDSHKPLFSLAMAEEWLRAMEACQPVAAQVVA